MANTSNISSTHFLEAQITERLKSNLREMLMKEAAQVVNLAVEELAEDLRLSVVEYRDTRYMTDLFEITVHDKRSMEEAINKIKAGV